ncbi:MAG: DUF4249 domain-containing protein [Prevotellaceae bacterium]|jgi:hypothetical protein|nr:DUF4249 domain-containing protein [Prevotellaceae bacterium]
MNRKPRLTAAALAAPLLLAACIGNDIPYTPAHRPVQLIMNALLESGAAENNVYLYLSDIDTIRAVNGATVTLSVNGNVVETGSELPQVDLPDYLDQSSLPGLVRSARYRFTTPLHPDDEVTLHAVTARGERHATASLTVPRPVEALCVDTVQTTILYNNASRPVTQYNITLTDNALRSDYYRLEILHECTACGKYGNGRDTVITWQHILPVINFDEPVLSDGRLSIGDLEGDEVDLLAENRYNIFTDNRFAGGSYTLKVYTAPADLYPPASMYDVTRLDRRPVVRLLTITEAEYHYLKVLNLLAWDGFASDLMEPLLIPSNVVGGTGFVGASAAATVVMESARP